MAANTGNVVEALKQEVPRLKETYSPQQLYIFGSHARGDALEVSDVDVVIVSDGFIGIPFLKRAVQVLELIRPSYGIDLLCYTPQEFARKKGEIGIVAESLKDRLDLLS